MFVPKKCTFATLCLIIRDALEMGKALFAILSCTSFIAPSAMGFERLFVRNAQRPSRRQMRLCTGYVSEAVKL